MKIDPSLIPGVTLAPGNKILTKKFFLTAGETDSRGLMPVKLIVMRAIETATDHSNVLGIGYSDLAEHHIGWVLARMSMEIKKYPSINEPYSMDTWIEGYNRFFSNRCHRMYDRDNNVIAEVRTVWVAIDTEKRKMANLSELDPAGFPLVDIPCGPQALPAPAIDRDTDFKSRQIRFETSDIDFNRHVNTNSYILVAINNFEVDFYDSHSVSRLDASFDHECYYGEDIVAEHGRDRGVDTAVTTELHRTNGQKVAAVRLVFRERS